MAKQKLAIISKYIISVVAIASAWYAASFVIDLLLAGAEDNPDMTAAVPKWLSFSSAVLSFPMFYLGNWDKAPVGMPDRDFAMLGFCAMIVNGVFWGLLLSSLFMVFGLIFPKMKGSSPGT